MKDTNDDQIIASSRLLPNGKTEYTMSNGAKYSVPAQATYLIEYLSYGRATNRKQTYRNPISIIGPSSKEGCFDTWNHKYNAPRTYSYEKTMCIIHTKTGEVIPSEEIQRELEKLRKNKF